MELFDDVEDLDEWLADLDYEGFWNEIEVFCLTLIEPRASCDAQIACGDIDRDTVLDVLKGMARSELVERLLLKPRDVMPWYSLH